MICVVKYVIIVVKIYICMSYSHSGTCIDSLPCVRAQLGLWNTNILSKAIITTRSYCVPVIIVCHVVLGFLMESVPRDYLLIIFSTQNYGGSVKFATFFSFLFQLLNKSMTVLPFCTLENLTLTKNFTVLSKISI